jgi:tRNA(Ile)-lysidine synthase
MRAVQQRVRKTVLRYALFPPAARVVIGLSGGSDSVALVFLLRDLSEHGNFDVAGLAHLNHSLRETAGRDEQFCRDLAGRLGLPIEVETVQVNEFAASEGLSLEDAGRRLRYRFLERSAASLGADVVAVGHTQDDQAETFQMKLMRGASLTGLGGIYPRRGAVVRPLLDVSRAELRSYLSDLGEIWMDDETNDDLRNPRNRIRHRVLPELDAALGGATRPNLARAAALAREDAEWLDARADEQFLALAVQRPDGLVFDTDRLAALPRPTGRRVLLRALRTVAGSHEVTLEHVEAGLALAGGAGGGIDVPGGRLEPQGTKLVLIRQKAGSK